MKRFAILALLALAGCAGLGTTTSVGTDIAQTGTDAQSLHAATMTTAQLASVIMTAGEKAQQWYAAYGNPGQALFGQNTGKVYNGQAVKAGIYPLDTSYPPAFEDLLACCIAGEDAMTGKWAVTPPSQAYLIATADEALRDMILINQMRTATIANPPAPNIMLQPAPLTPRHRLKATTQPASLIGLIAAKLPASAVAEYNKLPVQTRALIDADIPLVASWAESQLAQWWADYLAGDIVAARVPIKDGMSDDQLLADRKSSGDNATAAITGHVANNLAVLTAIKDIIGSLIPALLGAVGL